MGTNGEKKKQKSIFRAIFVPVILLMILQAGIFYFVAVYGGIEQSLNQNAADVFTERMTNRKNGIETMFTKQWDQLADCESDLNSLYASYQKAYGEKPLVSDDKRQISFLNDSKDTIIKTLRSNRVNGIFFILNDQEKPQMAVEGKEYKNGICIRDMDATTTYAGREDLLIERSPSSLISKIGCSLDSWWEPKYEFSSLAQGDYFYYPLREAWKNPDTNSDDLAYFSKAHQISGTDQEVVSYSIPLMDSQGYPYGVLGIEVTTKYLSSLLPQDELGSKDDSCYILAMQTEGSDALIPMVGTGALYSRCFTKGKKIRVEEGISVGGFETKGRGNVTLYGNSTQIGIYNNNNPFEQDKLILVALMEKHTLFYYSARVKWLLMIVTVFSLALAFVGILVVSRRFAGPITALAKKARNVEPSADIKLEHVGIEEIDQLVDSIESLNANISKEMARTDFFSRMSHDMRTPMNAIISFSSKEMLENTSEEERMDYLHKIHTSGEYLLGLINEVLDMTKIESNKVDLSYENVEAEKIWDALLPMVEKLAQKKQVQFRKSLNCDPKLHLLVDVQHINQIVLNLLSNAVKFTPEHGEVQMDTSFVRMDTEEEKYLCKIRISDTGRGMSSAFMEKMYTPFEQEHSGYGGTGLGLAISKKLVDLMDGSIRCESQENEGTTFWLRIPFLRGEEAKQQDTLQVDQAEESASDQKLQGLRVLLCEDHPLNAQIVIRLLQRKKIQVDLAENGQLGVEQFASQPVGTYQAVLMDIRMPVLDGLGASRAIRSMDREDAQTVPIIALTANAFEQDMKMSQEAGMDEHLSKPIEPDKLYEALYRLAVKTQQKEEDQ